MGLGFKKGFMETDRGTMTKRLIYIFIITLSLSAGAPMWAQQIPANTFFEQQGKPGEEDAYNAALEKMNAGDYEAAISGFDQVIKMRGRKADAALCWKASSQNKLGRRTDALSTIAELRKNYPQSPYLKQASVIEIDIKSAMGQPPDPTSEYDEETKGIALNVLMNEDPERAIPIVEKFLSGNSSPKLKERALFVLSQNGSPKAQELLGKIALGEQHPDLQSKAIHYLGIEGGRAAETLSKIYTSTQNPEIKKSVMHALMISGNKDKIFALAQQETSPELKREAIHQLGVMGAHDELRQLYKQSTSPEIKQELLHSMGIGGDVTSLIEIAKTETDPKVRESAIHSLGITGGHEAVAALVAIYKANADKNVKKQVVHSLFIHGDATDLVALAKNEADPEMKKEIVSRLSVMGSKEGNEYLMELLNK
jgi:HEAT repeat protein